MQNSKVKSQKGYPTPLLLNFVDPALLNSGIGVEECDATKAR
jgi:hypothetical protein